MRSKNASIFAGVCVGLFGFSTRALEKECDSELNAHLLELNPHVKANAEAVIGVYHSNFKDPNETTVTPMVNFATDVTTSDRTNVFVNGSIKYKVETTSEASEDTSSEGKKGAQIGDWRILFRDAYLHQKNDVFDAKIGFMTYTLGEQLLLDDRALGIDVTVPGKLFSTRFFAAGVLDPFSREKQNCISKNTFRPHDEEESNESETGTEKKGKGRNFSISKHFAGFRVDFSENNQHSTDAQQKASDKEDEFVATTMEQANTSRTHYGLLYLVESRDDFTTFRHFPGAFLNTSIATVDLNAETALQLYDGDSTLGYLGKAYRSFVLPDSQIVKLFTGYTAFNTIKGDSAFEPSYSNIFLGEVNQYLTKENNIAFVGGSYHPNSSLEFQFGSYHKILDQNSSEFDLNTTYYYYKYSKIKVGANWIYGKAFPDERYQVYAEIRHIL